MNRNNAFMLSYIAFIIICILVRMFTDYPMWNVIVSAITVSSWFFAIGDANISDAEDLQQLLDAWYRFSEKEKINTDKLLPKAIEAKERFLKKEDVDDEKAAEIVGMMNEAIEYLQSVNKEDKDFENALRKKKQKIANCQKCGLWCTILGFLTFFSIVTFQKIGEVVIGVQDYTTVSAFAIILMSQYQSERRRKHNREFSTMIDKAINQWDDCCNHIEESLKYAD